MEERGHRYEDVMAAINSRRPDFNAYIEPQEFDVVIQVLPTVDQNDRERRVLRYALQREGIDLEPVYLFDEGSTIVDTCGASSPAPTLVCKCFTAR